MIIVVPCSSTQFCNSKIRLVFICLRGRRKGRQGGLGPLDFENFTKKGCFLSFEWEKTNFTTFGPPWKNFGKIPWCPP